MPVVLRYRGYRFFFFSQQGSEPIQVHVRKGSQRAKYWVEPEVAVVYSIDMNISEVNEIRRVIERHRRRIVEAWHEHFRHLGN